MMRNKDTPCYLNKANVLESFDIDNRTIESTPTIAAWSAKENIVMDQCSCNKGNEEERTEEERTEEERTEEERTEEERTSSCSSQHLVRGEYSETISSDLDCTIDHPSQLGLEFFSEQTGEESGEPVDVAGKKSFSQPVGVNGFVDCGSKSRRRQWLRPRGKLNLLLTNDCATPFQAATASPPEEVSVPQQSASGT